MPARPQQPESSRSASTPAWGVQHLVGVLVGLLDGLGAELHHQEGVPLGQLVDRLLIEVLEPLVVDQMTVDALQRDRLVRQDRRYGVRGERDVPEPQHHQRAFLHHRHQLQLRPQDPATATHSRSPEHT
ncbi:hypothetical protein PBV52_36875 [Streptomyces sp. T12]|uniref:hypothetical protein n=1 Tax=Streptomyces sp. T12 TaxID=477697 RepID=UPI00236552FA|nr:hypothetical protein [Streptomyces sp. T12]WDF41981.1 hypothetical protein PBV52_36875 [Streptomyces sp. T12]